MSLKVQKKDPELVLKIFKHYMKLDKLEVQPTEKDLGLDFV